MATQYAFGKIVTDGLVLALDAADRNSYVSGSTTWFDLSGNNNSGSLVNGPTFNAANGGSFALDGISQYLDIPYNTSLDLPIARTTSVWVKLRSDTTFQTLIGQSKTGAFNQRKWDVRYGAASSTDKLIRVVIGQGVAQTSLDSSTTFDLTARWHNVAVSFDGNITTLKLYINGVLSNFSTSSFSSLYSSVTNGDTTLGFNIGRRNEGNNPSNGFFSNFMVYNRMLNDIEILQNYNAQKSRFNL